MKTTTVQQFFKQFPDDNTCLNFLMRKHYGDTLDCPKCHKHGKFHRIKRHPAYKCAWCGYEIYPRHDLCRFPHTPAKVVLCHLPVHYDQAWCTGP